MPAIQTRDGTSIHVETYGEGSGDAVLLLHGALADNLQNWRLMHPLLSKKHGLVGLDLRGHGRSDNPSGVFTLEALRDDVVDVLDALALPRVHVLGASLGGYVGLALRHAHPGRVASLATAGSKIGWDEAAAKKRASRFQPEAILREHPLWAPHLKKAHGTFYGEEHWKTIVAWVRDLLLTLPDKPEVGLERLAADKDVLPLFYAIGDRDDLAPLEETVNIMQVRPDAALMVAPQAGHLFREYNQEAFAACYLDFLRRVARR